MVMGVWKKFVHDDRANGRLLSYDLKAGRLWYLSI